MQGSGNGGGSGHIANYWCASEKTSNGETSTGKIEVSFGAFFVEFGTFYLDGSGVIGAIGDSGLSASEMSKLVIVGIVGIKNDNIWIHLEESVVGLTIF